MKAENAHNVQSVSWDPGMPGVSSKAMSQRAQPSLKAREPGALRAGQDLHARLCRQAEWPNPPFLQLWLYSGPQLTGLGPPTMGRANYFTQSADSNANLLWEHPHRQSPEMMVNQLCWHPVIQSNGHITSAIPVYLYTAQPRKDKLKVDSDVCLWGVGSGWEGDSFGHWTPVSTLHVF